MTDADAIAANGARIRAALDRGREEAGPGAGNRVALGTLHGAAEHIAAVYGPQVAFETLADLADTFLRRSQGWPA